MAAVAEEEVAEVLARAELLAGEAEEEAGAQVGLAAAAQGFLFSTQDEDGVAAAARACVVPT